jgi:hypothetical protein
MKNETKKEGEGKMKINKINVLPDGRILMAWFANNAGRGSDNCTLAVVAAGTPRATYSRNQTNVVASTRTSSWAGKVNFSARVRNILGIEQYNF